MRPPAFWLCKAHLFLADVFDRWSVWHLKRAGEIADEYKRRMDMCR